MQTQYDPNEQARMRRRTYIGYGAILLALLLVVLFSARQVIFRPWTARLSVAVAPYTGGFFVFGGRSERNELYDDIMRVDLVTGQLHRVGHLPRQLTGASAVNAGSAIYVLGGTNRSGTYDDIYRLDPATGHLSHDGLLPGPTAYAAVVATGGRIYCLGGYDGSRYLDRIVAYDPSTHQSSLVGTLPQPEDQLSAEALGSDIYVFGGEGAGGKMMDDILQFVDAGDGKLVGKVVGHLDRPRDRAGSTVFNGSVFLVGGWADGVANDVVMLTKSPSGESVTDGARFGPFAATEFPNITYDISGSSPVAFGDALYLVGGREQRYQRQIQIIRFDPKDGSTKNVQLKSYVFW